VVAGFFQHPPGDVSETDDVDFTCTSAFDDSSLAGFGRTSAVCLDADGGYSALSTEGFLLLLAPDVGVFLVCADSPNLSLDDCGSLFAEQSVGVRFGDCFLAGVGLLE